MKNIYLFLAMTAVMIFLSPLKSEAQQKRTTTFGVTENSGKPIKYGPWRMQNNFKLPSYNFEEYFSYGSGKVREHGGVSGKPRQINKITSGQFSILKLTQNASLTVLKGQQYSVEVGYFNFDKNAYAAMQKIAAITSLPVIVIIKNGIYHILIEGFSSLRDANRFIGQLGKIGYPGTIVKINNPGKVSTSTI